MSPHELLGPLLRPALHLGSTPTTWAEVLGFGTGAVNVCASGRHTGAGRGSVTYRHGLVVGRFHPPHAGHHHLFATGLWHERYLGAASPDVERLHARARHDLWILTDTAGVPFEQDGWRDGETIRARMSGRFAEELVRRGLPHVTVTGPHERRLTDAVAAVDALLAEHRVL